MNYIRNYMLKGSITIYLAITMTVILSLIFSVLESARISSLQTRAKALTYLSLDSAFSDFALQMFNKYGIFGVFCSEEDFLASVKYYADKNCNNSSLMPSFNLFNLKPEDISFNSYCHLTDNDGLIFAKQAVAYEKYRSISSTINKLADVETNYKNHALANPYDGDFSSFTMTPDMILLMNTISEKDSSDYKDISSEKARLLKDNIVSKVSALLKSNLLLFFCDNAKSISDFSIPEEMHNNFPSVRCTLSEKAYNYDLYDTSSKSLYDIADKAVFTSYINNSFSSYDTHINNDLSLKYQKEYILSGKTADNDCLLSTAMSIVSRRAILNLAYLLSDSSKRGAAFNIASSISGHIPVVSQTLTFIILSSWSYAEALIDVRDLFQGKKVPLMKTDDIWNLSPEGIITMNKNTLSKNDGNSGLCYDEYLNLCLLTTNPYVLYFRTMDLVQMDMCENYNPDFNIAACIFGADIHISYQASPLFTGLIKNIIPDSYTFNADISYYYD